MTSDMVVFVDPPFRDDWYPCRTMVAIIDAYNDFALAGDYVNGSKELEHFDLHQFFCLKCKGTAVTP